MSLPNQLQRDPAAVAHTQQACIFGWLQHVGRPMRWPSTKCSIPRALSAAYKGIYEQAPSGRVRTPRPRADALGRAFIDQGITFSLSGQEQRSRSTWYLRVISAPSGPDWNVASPSGWASSATSTASMVIRDSARRCHPAPVGDLL